MPELVSKKKMGTLPRPRRRNLLMHSSQCSICRHPQRAEIERDFLDWAGPWDIVRDYDLGSHTTVYRHAHALGLFERRERTLRFALGRLIERVDCVRPTAASIVSAIRLMAKLNGRSEYAEEAEDSETQELADVTVPDASAKDESDASLGEATLRVARAPAIVKGGPARPRQNEPLARQAKAADSNGKPKVEKQDDNDYNGPPIEFAQNVGPWRRFFWR